MKEESLTSVGNLTTTTSTGSTVTNIMYDEAGQFPGLQFVDPLINTGTTIHFPQPSYGSYICPATPEGIGALGEVLVDEQGFTFVYSTEGWLQVNRVAGPGLWEQIHGKEEEIIKGDKKKLKCF
tara:strand:+ start:9835 stop:10206 length:372 start_codon:yes stop_codon:yes gene_type:complete